MSVNKVIVLGRLGKDPEIKWLPTGTAVCNFSVAVSDSWADKDGKKQEKTEWISVVTFKKLAELCNKYLAKGSMCYVEGKMQTRMWEVNDIKHYRTEVIADKVDFLSPKKADAEDVQEKITTEAVPF
jgi:single-strand DNA-binding protein